MRPDVLAEHARHPRRRRLRHAPPRRLRAAVRPRRHARARLRHLLRLRAVRERAGQRDEQEYLHSEKYELKAAGLRADRGSLAPLIRAVNELRPPPPGVWALRDVRFHHADDERFLVYSRGHVDTRPAPLRRPPRSAPRRGTRPCASTSAPSACPPDQPYQLHDELTGETYVWGGDAGYVRLDPDRGPGRPPPPRHPLTVCQPGTE